jgi:hypothetical protein
MIAILKKLGMQHFVRLIRNGLDMAYSSNQNQLKLWGRNFIDEPFDISPRYSLIFWRIVNQRALDIGKSLGGNFLCLNFDQLTLYPEPVAKRLCGFLGLEEVIFVPALTAQVR